MSRASGSRAIFVVGLISTAGIFAVRPSLSYRVLELELSAYWAGLLGSAYAIAPLLTILLIGRFVSQVGARGAITGGAGVMAVACALLAPSSTPAVLLTGTILLGLAHFTLLVGLQVAARHASDSDGSVQAAFNNLSLSLAAGQVVGPTLLWMPNPEGMLSETAMVMFVCSAGLAVLAVFSFVSFRTMQPKQHSVVESENYSWITIVRIPFMVRIVTVSGLVVASIDLIAIFLPLLGDERGYSSTVVAWLMVVRGVAAVLIRLVLMKLIRRWTSPRVAFWGTLTAAVGLACVLLPVHVGVLFGIFFIVGLGLGVGDPITGAWTSLYAPRSGQAKAASLRIASNRLGQVVVPAVAGLVTPVLGMTSGFALVCGCLASAAVVVRTVANPGEGRGSV